MTTLISGGAGFIGTRLLGALDDDVVVVDNLHEQVHGPRASWPLSRENVRYVHGDVTQPEDWDRVLQMERVHNVVHLAAETGTGQSLFQASRHANVNVNGTAVMLDAFARNKQVPDSIVLTSSRAVYGEGKWVDENGVEFYGKTRTADRLSREMWLPVGPEGQFGEARAHSAKDTEARPSNVYAATKLAQENVLSAWAASLGVGLSILRLQNVYGAGQALRNPYTGVLTAFAQQVISNAPVNVFEGGGIVRDFVHVSDVVSAIASSLRTLPRDGFRRLDIGSGHPGTLLDFAQTLAAGSSSVVSVSNDYRLGDVRAAHADNTAAAEDLGYQPTISFEEGAQELLSWAREEVAREH